MHSEGNAVPREDHPRLTRARTQKLNVQWTLSLTRKAQRKLQRSAARWMFLQPEVKSQVTGVPRQRGKGHEYSFGQRLHTHTSSRAMLDASLRLRIKCAFPARLLVPSDRCSCLQVSRRPPTRPHAPSRHFQLRTATRYPRL